MRFREHVLQQKSEDKEVFKFSRQINGKRVQLQPEELAKNLEKLLVEASCIPVNGPPHLLVGKTIHHRFEEGDDDGTVVNWYKGKVLSSVKIVLSVLLAGTGTFGKSTDMIHQGMAVHAN